MESSQFKDPNKTKNDPKSHQFCSKQVDFIYDTIAIIISLFDITTDIWICITWYYEGRFIFFIFSLVILILANFAYVLVFFSRYGELDPLQICCLGCCMMPCAPFLAMIMYFGDTFECCSFELPCFDVEKWNDYDDGGDGSQSRKWMETKLARHMGFLLEAIIEAFPQCILQMIAIMIYDETNLIAIISIIVSMISISSKSLIFSAATSYNIKTMIFSWFYFVSDMFGIFFVLSFVFYSGDDIDNDVIKLLNNIWLYKIYIFIIPICFLFSLPVYYWGYEELKYKASYNYDGCMRGFVMAFCVILIFPLWILGMILGSILLEMLCYSYIAYIIYVFGHGRIPTNISSNTWKEIIEWIKSSTDEVVRTCCVNRQLLLMKNTDELLFNHLEKKEHSTQYKDITYKGIRKMYKRNGYGSVASPKHIFYHRFKETFTGDRAFYCFVGYYMLSRIVTFIFPYLIIILIMMNGGSVIYDLPLFQLVMLCIMLGFILIMVILLCVIWREERIIFHILPIRAKRLYTGVDGYLTELVSSYYERLIIKPKLKITLVEIFGNDIGTLLYQFIPFGLEEEEHAIELKKKANSYTHERETRMIQRAVRAGFRRYVWV